MDLNKGELLMDILRHKGYEGTAEIDMDRYVCRGKILFINDLIIYEASSTAELQHAFEAAVDDYLDTCVELGREPQKPLKGLFNVRVSPEIYRLCALRAKTDGITLNDVAARALTAYVNTNPEVNNTVNVTIVASGKMETGIATGSQEPVYKTMRSENATH